MRLAYDGLIPAHCASSFGVIVFAMPKLLQFERFHATPSPKKCFNLSKWAENGIFQGVMHDDFDDTDTLPGQRLKAWRLKRGLTQTQLAKMVGTVSGQISLLENGERQLSVKWLLKLADALDVSAGWLLDHDPDELPPDIHEIWGAIPAPQQHLARDVLSAFRPEPPKKDGTNG